MMDQTSLFTLDDDGMVIAMKGVVPPKPWELHESSKFQGFILLSFLFVKAKFTTSFPIPLSGRFYFFNIDTRATAWTLPQWSPESIEEVKPVQKSRIGSLKSLSSGNFKSMTSITASKASNYSPPGSSMTSPISVETISEHGEEGRHINQSNLSSAPSSKNALSGKDMKKCSSKSFDSKLTGSHSTNDLRIQTADLLPRTDDKGTLLSSKSMRQNMLTRATAGLTKLPSMTNIRNIKVALLKVLFRNALIFDNSNYFSSGRRPLEPNSWRSTTILF